MRASMNVADILGYRDRCEQEAVELEESVVLARRVGHRWWEATLLGELSWPLALTGRWKEALACFEQLPEEVFGVGTFLLALPELLVAQDRRVEAQRLLALYERFESSADVQERSIWSAGQAVLLRAEGKDREALRAAEEALAAIDVLGTASQPAKVAFLQALEAALALGERERAKELLARVDTLPPGRLAPSLRAHAARFRARLAAADGHDRQAEAGFAVAASTFREFGMPFWLAVTLLEHGEWLVSQGRVGEAEPVLAEAREIFGRLEAKPWLERANEVAAVRRRPESVPTG
jgi:tetratricopeptide (TPR) repeat protein